MAEQVFVAREAELDRLQALLHKALAGETQVCFVSGDAGAGKSALIAAFARRAQTAEETLLVALGECNAQTGLGDPFLPFRGILAQLTGDTDITIEGKVTAQNTERLTNLARKSGRA
jgi:predicted ATPase